MSERAQFPTGPSGVDAPSACAASSTTTRGRVVSADEVDGQPGVVHGDQRVARADRGRVEVQRLRDRCRRSRRSRRRSAAQFALATNESGDVSTRSPGPIPAAESAACSAAVPFANATACAAPRLRAQRALELVDRGPARQPVAAQDRGDRGDVVVLDELAAIRDHTSQFGGLPADLSW